MDGMSHHEPDGLFLSTHNFNKYELYVSRADNYMVMSMRNSPCMIRSDHKCMQEHPNDGIDPVSW